MALERVGMRKSQVISAVLLELRDENRQHDQEAFQCSSRQLP
jgi:hypothetical protein